MVYRMFQFWRGFFFHGQSTVKFGFSANDNKSVISQSDFLLIALRRFKDHLHANNLDLHSRKHAKKFRRFVLNAMKFKKRKRLSQKKKERKWKIISDPLNEII